MMSRANWKRAGSHQVDPCDQRGCTALAGDFTTWFALGSLELMGRGVGCEPQAPPSRHQVRSHRAAAHTLLHATCRLARASGWDSHQGASVYREE